MKPMPPSFNFPEVIIGLEGGRSYYRYGWNGKGMWITLQVPDMNSKMTRPYVYMTIPAEATAQFGEDKPKGLQRIPWLVSQTDLFAKDWYLADEEYRKGVE